MVQPFDMDALDQDGPAFRTPPASPQKSTPPPINRPDRPARYYSCPIHGVVITPEDQYWAGINCVQCD